MYIVHDVRVTYSVVCPIDQHSSCLEPSDSRKAVVCYSYLHSRLVTTYHVPQ